MKIINFGSLNIDNVYKVKQFVRAGETISADGWEFFGGGKGNNQSIAMARARVKNLFHAGCIGKNGIWLKECLEKEGVDCRFLRTLDDEPTGHAVIQVSETGENCIIICGGANLSVRRDHIDEVIDFMDKDDILLLQNEINAIPEIMSEASRKGVRIFFNPAPMSDSVLDYPLDTVNTLIVNETEASALSRQNSITDYTELANMIRSKYPRMNLLLTLGARGAFYAGEETVFVPAEKVKAVDTTGAGDTFIGYFLAGILKKMNMETVLKNAAKAAAVSVTRKGASDSIPYFTELS